MGVDIRTFKESIQAQVIQAYLVESKSHRRIQEEILGIEAPPRGGGFVAMQILHHYGIDGSKKGVLFRTSFEEEYSEATGLYKEALEIMRKHS